MAIDLSRGTTVRRTELHERYGGRRQGGISPSRVSPNVFIFTDPARGVLHGYLYDGWRDDGLFHYTGEGQVGDQLMAQGNRAVRDHREEARELHVFEGSAGEATYVGEFEYVDSYLADAPETNEGPVRSVIVFRLRPLDAEPGPNRSRIDQLGREAVKEVPVEQHLTESTLIEGAREPYEAERREQKLVRAFLAHLTGEGHDVARLQLRPEGEPAPLFCDLYDKTTNTVFEAKGSVARQAIRMAIGQLADYARLIHPEPQRALLLPQEPRCDLIDLTRSQGVELRWQKGSGFESA